MSGRARASPQPSRGDSAVVTRPDTLEIHIRGPAAADDAYALPTRREPPVPQAPLEKLRRLASPSLRDHDPAAGTHIRAVPWAEPPAPPPHRA